MQADIRALKHARMYSQSAQLCVLASQACACIYMFALVCSGLRWGLMQPFAHLSLNAWCVPPAMLAAMG